MICLEKSGCNGWLSSQRLHKTCAVLHMFNRRFSKLCRLRLLEIRMCGHNMSQKASLMCFILLHPSWHFGTKAKARSAGSGHELRISRRDGIQKPRRRKSPAISCSSCVLGECHRQKLNFFWKGPSGPPTQKQTWPMEFSYCRFVFKTALILQPVDTRSLRSARRRMMALGKFMIDIWPLQRLAWLSRLSTPSESYTPQK